MLYADGTYWQPEAMQDAKPSQTPVVHTFTHQPDRKGKGRVLDKEGGAIILAKPEMALLANAMV